MYDIKAVYEAASTAEAIDLLQKHPQAVLIAGGSDVLIKIREGKLAGCELVSLQGITELKGVEKDANGTIIIKPLATFTALSRHPLIRQDLAVLAGAAEQVGGPQIRNIGTIGGNICNGVTSADTASTLLALNAQLELSGPGGKRLLAISDWYVGPGKVALKPFELLTAIHIAQKDYAGYSGHYIKYAMRKAMDIATLGCAAIVKLRADSSVHYIEDLRLAFGVAGPVPMRCPKAEAAALGKRACPELYKTVAETALSEVSPRTSWRASKEFRLQLVSELSQRALSQAVYAATNGEHTGGKAHD